MKNQQEFCNLEKNKVVEKTIKKTGNGKVITEQSELLNQIRQFYENLYKDRHINLNNNDQWDWNLIDKQLTKLAPNEALNIEGPLTIKEIGVALKGIKHNKTPGINGFPAEFYKMFWGKLKFFVLRAYNYSFLKGEMPLSLRQTIISCLPKGNKQRDLLKNWRPISL